MLSDAYSLLGLEVPEFDKETQVRFKKRMPTHAPFPRNLFDFASGMRTELHEVNMIEQIASLPYIDSVITHIPRRISPGKLPEELEDVVAACRVMGSIPRKYGKPLVVLSFSE